MPYVPTPKRRKKDAADAPKERPKGKGSIRKPQPLPPVKLNKIGRPSVYDPSYVELVLRLALLGQTEEETAITLGIDFITFRRWMELYPDLRAARAEGGELADAAVAQAMFKRAMGYTHKGVKIFLPKGATTEEEAVIVEHDVHYPPSETAGALWLTNRSKAKWKQRQVEETDPEKPGVKVEGGLPD